MTLYVSSLDLNLTSNLSKMAVDAYTHDSYTLMKPTALLLEAVEHVLSLQDGEAAPESLRRELQAWPGRGKEKEEEEDGIETVDASVLDRVAGAGVRGGEASAPGAGEASHG